MSLRARIITYLAGLHVVFAALAVPLLRHAPLWLFGIELLFVLSLGVGVHLARRALQSLAFAADATRLLREDELTSRFTPVGDPEIDALIAVYNRMVDRLRDERVRLQEQHHFFRQVVDASPAGLLVLDFDGRVSDLNPAAERLMGQTRAAAMGEPIAAADSPLAEALAALPPGGAAIVSLSGPRRIKLQHGTFVDRGFPRRFFVLTELTEELRQFERTAYEKLIRVMSHEVNNTVTATNSLLESSLTYTRDLPAATRPDVDHALRVVIDRAEQLRQFLRRFADVFRLPPPLREPWPLTRLVEPVVQLVAARPDAAGIHWTWAVDAEPIVSVDRGQFEQACLNIITNAVEAAGPDGHIHLRVTMRADRPALVVEDSGPGLSPDAQENIFTPFFSTKPHGQGIGLTLVREILTAHGCDFTLERPAGGPTAFTIRF